MKKKLLIIPAILLTIGLTGCNLSFVDRFLGVSIIDDEEESSEVSSSGESESSSSSQNTLVTSIVLENSVLTIKGSQTVKLKANVYPKSAKNRNVVWGTSDASILTVDDTGNVTTHAPGDAIVTVSAVDGSGVTATCDIKVEYVAVTGIKLSPTFLSIDEGATSQLTATILPENASYQNVIWSSSDDTVAQVNENGVVSGLSTGSANITVETVDCHKTATQFVTVSYSNSAIVKATSKYTYRDVDSKQYVENRGDQKVLVIPTYFSDEPMNATLANAEFIETSFFGSNVDCKWRSFAGYYEEASFNQLHYSGHVCHEWYPCEYTVAQVLANNELSKTIASKALEWFKLQYPTFDWTGYDSDEDGTVDSLYIIYASDYVDNNSSLWGYRWTTNVQAGNGLQAHAYSWFSLKFLTETSSYGGVPDGGSNTRIIIHEHGHMLGLADYYDTSYSGIDLVGRYDMQDCNQFDWNAFSKYSVGWLSPYYIRQDILEAKGSETITIRSSAENGDCILVRNSAWNGSPFDEYLLLELFNPNLGNNEYDFNYGGTTGVDYGVKIFHVDARMARYYIENFNIVSEEVDEIDNNAKYTYFIPNDNDEINSATHNAIGKQVGFTSFTNYHLLQLLQKEGTNTFDDPSGSARHTWQQSDLWQTGDTFSIGNHVGYYDYGPGFFYNNTTFNDGTSLPYGITFDNVTADSATITFTYLG